MRTRLICIAALALVSCAHDFEPHQTGDAVLIPPVSIERPRPTTTWPQLRRAEPTTTTETPPTLPPTTAARVEAQSVDEPVHAEPAPVADDGIEQLILDVFGHDATGSKALDVAWCESRYNPAAVNGRHRGLFQISSVHVARIESMGYTWDDMLSAGPNVDVAHAIYVEQGWGPWSCA